MSGRIITEINRIDIRPGDSLVIHWSRWNKKANKNRPEPGRYEFGTLTLSQPDGLKDLEIIFNEREPKIIDKRVK
jgi:hypothetical protein